MQIIFDRWHQGVVTKAIIFIKRFSQLEDLIIRLDQSEFTEVIVQNPLTELHICGGNERYTCSCSINGEVYDLINNEHLPSRKFIPVIITGEQILCPPGKVISIENILRAVEYYYKHGAMDTTLKWKKRA